MFILGIKKKESKDSLQKMRAIISTAETLYISEIFASSLDEVEIIKEGRVTVKRDVWGWNYSGLKKVWMLTCADW